MAEVLHIYFSTIENESRLMRSAISVKRNFPETNITICGKWSKGLPEEEKYSEGISIVRLKAEPGKIRGFKTMTLQNNWTSAILNRFNKSSFNIIHCHSLFDLKPSVALKNKINCRIIYDAHELETERNGLKGIRKYLDKRKEKKYIYKSDETIVVCKSISDWYNKTYPKINVSIVRNIPEAKKIIETKSDYFRNKFNIPRNSVVFLYLGYLNTGRGIELISEAFKRNSLHHVVFTGYGPLEELIKNISKTCPNIHFHEKVKGSEVLEHASSADIGLSLIENTCLSYFYCLPNKVYEYIYAGIPVLCSNFPEMSAFVTEKRTGWAIDPSVNELLAFLNNISFDKIDEKKEVIKTYKHDNWAEEEKELITIYKRQLYR